MKPLLNQSEGLYKLFKQYKRTKPGLPPSILAILFPNLTDNQNSNNASEFLSPFNNEYILRTKALIRQLSDANSIIGKNSAVISPPKTS